MPIINTLAPVFLVIALGAALRRSGFWSEQFATNCNRLAYWVGLPCLLFKEIAVAPPAAGQTFQVLAILLAGLAGCLGVAYLLAWLCRMPGGRVGTFVQAAYRGNLAYVGLAVVFYGFTVNAGDGGGAAARQAAILVLAPMIPVYNITAVIVLLAKDRRMRWADLRRMGFQIMTNPLLISCVAGLLYAALPVGLPTAVANTCDVIGRMALPLALLAAGGAIASTHLGKGVGLALVAALIKTGVAPAVGYGVARAIGAGPQETAIAMILLATPTAIVSYVMADQLKGDGPLAAQAIVVSTLLSVFSLAVAVAMI